MSGPGSVVGVQRRGALQTSETRSLTVPPIKKPEVSPRVLKEVQSIIHKYQKDVRNWNKREIEKRTLAARKMGIYQLLREALGASHDPSVELEFQDGPGGVSLRVTKTTGRFVQVTFFTLPHQRPEEEPKPLRVETKSAVAEEPFSGTELAQMTARSVFDCYADRFWERWSSGDWPTPGKEQEVIEEIKELLNIPMKTKVSLDIDAGESGIRITLSANGETIFDGFERKPERETLVPPEIEINKLSYNEMLPQGTRRISFDGDLRLIDLNYVDILDYGVQLDGSTISFVRGGKPLTLEVTKDVEFVNMRRLGRDLRVEMYSRMPNGRLSMRGVSVSPHGNWRKVAD